MKQINTERFWQKLESQRKDEIHFLRRLGHESRSLDRDSPQDSADLCVVSMSKESLFEQSSQRRTILRLIDAALQRIKNGSFGICVACGEQIQVRRLEAVPWTQFCLHCQEELEEEVDASLARNVAPPGQLWRRAG